MNIPVLFIVGPTGVGKSSLAIDLARRLNGEIISADSMLVYKGMDIGTAKPSKQERKVVRHHLIDLFSPSRNFSVFDYREKAIRALSEITSRGKLPIVVGGSGLYVQSLLFGLSVKPGPDLKFRHEMEKFVKSEGLEALYEKLKAENPEQAERIPPSDKKRMIRALETSRPFISNSQEAEVIASPDLKSLGYKPVIFGITKDREMLYRDIESRVDAMFRHGLVREVKKLMKKRISKTAAQAIGYRELITAIKNREKSFASTMELIKRNTRRLAKRQWTWFRRYSEITWFILGRDVIDRDKIAESIINILLKAK